MQSNAAKVVKEKATELSTKQMGIFINGRKQKKKIIDFYCSASCKFKELDIPRSMIINKMRFAKRVYI